MAASCGILNEPVHRTPIAVLDFETTGLNAGADRVIELSVVRIEPGGEPQVVLDTLICPNRPVAATDIHGITDDDVADAPTFTDIADDVLRAISGCVIGAYNVYFDIRFLRYELHAAGLDLHSPYVCLMYMRPLLELGGRCSLDDACRELGVQHSATHQAASDALAAARLWPVYLDQMRRLDVRSFGDLAERRSYKFFESFGDLPLEVAATQSLTTGARLKPRGVTPEPRGVAAAPSDRDDARLTPRRARRLYWEAMKAVLADLVITDDEVEYLDRTQKQQGLETEQIRSLHARAFAQVILSFTDDRWLYDRETETLHRLHGCFSRLGWAPGEPARASIRSRSRRWPGASVSAIGFPSLRPARAHRPFGGAVFLYSGDLAGTPLACIAGPDEFDGIGVHAVNNSAHAAFVGASAPFEEGVYVWAGGPPGCDEDADDEYLVIATSAGPYSCFRPSGVTFSGRGSSFAGRPKPWTERRWRRG